MASESLSPGRIALGGRESRSRGVRRAETEAERPDDVALVRQGDEPALRRMIVEYSSMVYAVALRVTRCEADAEEVLQEVFIGLPEALRNFDGGNFDGGNFAGWLKVATRNRARTLLRSESRWRRHRGAPATVESPEDATLRLIAVERALAKIDPSLRTVLLLREVQGFSHKEIADTMHISENLSQVRLHRARCALLELVSP